MAGGASRAEWPSGGAGLWGRWGRLQVTAARQRRFEPLVEMLQRRSTAWEGEQSKIPAASMQLIESLVHAPDSVLQRARHRAELQELGADFVWLTGIRLRTGVGGDNGIDHHKN
eukprot:COSAG01_NODE_792_length_13554_cov_13.811891_4_plen_114_part_00